MNHVSIKRKVFKTDRQCFMCGDRIKIVVIILSSLHGFLLCPNCAAELKEVMEDFEMDDED
jgi:hypothetical protein